MAVATGIPVFHVDERNGNAFLPAHAACRIDDSGTVDTTALAAPLEQEERTYGERIDRVIAKNRSTLR